ncbi:MAG: hypothetical protein WD009_13550 [Phycisphaeraceae bacterium]
MKRKSLSTLGLVMGLTVATALGAASPALGQGGRERPQGDREQMQQRREQMQQRREQMLQQGEAVPRGPGMGMAGEAPGAGGAGLGFQLGQVLRLLGLEPEQRQQIGAAVREHGPALREAGERVAQQRDELMQLLYVEQTNERTLREQAERFGQAVAAHALEHRALAVEIADALTDEQLDTLRQWFSGAEARQELIREQRGDSGMGPDADRPRMRGGRPGGGMGPMRDGEQGEGQRRPDRR